MKSIQTINQEAGSRLKSRGRAIFAALAIMGFLMLGVLGMASADVAGDVGIQESAPLCATLIPFALMGGLRDEDPGGPDGGGDIESKILKKLDDQKKAFEEIEKNLGNISETKAEAEELHKAMKSFEGTTNDVKTIVSKMAELESKMRNVRREVSGNPLQRISDDEQMRSAIVNAIKVPWLRKMGKENQITEEMAEQFRAINDLGGQRAITGGSGVGSNYIDDELSPLIYQLTAEYGITDNFTVSRPKKRTTKLIVTTADSEFLFEDEGDMGSERAPTGSQVSTVLKKAGGWLGMSTEMLEDDEVGVVNTVLGGFMRQMKKRADHINLAADGDSNGVDGGFSGIFDAGTAFPLGSGDVSIANVVYDDFVNLIAGADEGIDGPDAKWFGHPRMLVQLLKLKDSNGRPIFQSAIDAPTVGGFGSILGYPVVKANAAPNTDGASKPLFAWGDCKAQHFALGQDFQFASSADALFTEDQVAFRARARMAGKLRTATAFEVMTTAAE